MTHKQFMKWYLITFVAFLIWIIGGIMAIPMEYRQFDDDLRVTPLKIGAITEPSDIQPAMGYRVVENSYNPQQQ